MDAANVVLGKVVDLLFRQVGRQIRYLFRYRDNIDKFSKKTEDLKGLRLRMKGRIDEAVLKGQVIEDDVQTWIRSVDNISSDAETFLATEDVATNKTACFNLSSRYGSSKKATRKTESVLDLLEKGNKFMDMAVARAADLPGMDVHPSTNIDAYKSQRSAMQAVTDALKDESTHIVGVFGMGGVGKTTLVTELGKRMKASKQFDEVVMVVVSQPVNINKIQDDIAGLLGMGKLPENGELRKGQLWNRINEKKILFILDDLWSRLELDQLGVPTGVSKCQIILTSRSKEVCKEMDAQKLVSVTPMPEEEAWSLFKEVAGEAVETDQDINSIARKVAEECGGLPIAILAVGRALRDEIKDEWETAYHQMREAAPPHVNPMLVKVFPKLELSYRRLRTEEAKMCFLLCCLFLEDYDIPIEVLARYGMSLRLFQGAESLKDARFGARNAVHTLKHSCLLLEGKDNHHVKMHDVVRDVAIAIASQHEKNMFLVKAGMGLTDWPETDSYNSYTGISLMANSISKLPVGLECPQLQILLLQRNKSLQETPNEFFQRLENLKVLDLRRCGISSLPPSLSLPTLRSLYLGGLKVKEITVLEGLSKLEILSLCYTDIVQIPEQIGRLTNLRLLDIRSCMKLKHIAAGVISSLRKLEDLYIGDSFTQWDMEDEGKETKNASLTELNFLPHLTNMEIVMPDTERLPHNLQFGSLQRFNIGIGSAHHYYKVEMKEYPECCILSLTWDMHKPLWGWMKKLLKAVDCLSLKVRNLNHLINDLNDVNFNRLRVLRMISGDGVSSLTNSLDMASMPVFCNLEMLFLCELPNITQIYEGQLLPIGGPFSKLTHLEITECEKMSIALGSNILSSLQNLRRLEIRFCMSMEHIIGAECEFGGLENPIGEHTGASFLQNLRSVRLSLCGNLRYVFPPSVVKQLLQLESIHILYCRNVEAIIGTSSDLETGETTDKKMTVFPSLRMVTLQGLDRLKRFCKEHGNITEYPSLSVLEVFRCPNLELTPNLKALIELIASDESDESDAD